MGRTLGRAALEAEPLRRRVIVDRDVIVVDLLSQHLPRAAPRTSNSKSRP